ncbi:FtsK/SpoIIIE domain-containing protein [Arthrobacter sp. BE255]|uniref:FtsK/SpoIIIE domain-containing protein n=1 Tax=Arthrobacter sp. BE255 TaxID=2817721 RepID=UPI00285C0058|nr:FtsK/SpoIIIE domain-containing protein [Arthrobacter sp. BE255]MDR7157733.1 S-DNA-T family DNA segregation ATPase FtsK/SpoIIIE [Arthrobacter sp. BE255]
MPLECTLVRSPGTGLVQTPLELTVDASIGTGGADLQAELGARFGTGVLSVDGFQLASLTVGEPPLVNGAVIVDGGTRSLGGKPRRPSGLPAPLALAVLSGTGAGTVVPLRRGTYSIGRSKADIVIPDPELSRQHARLLVSETAITIEDLDSANGTEVDGERVRNTVVTTGSVIHCGNSTMSLIFVDAPGVKLEEAGSDVYEPLLIQRRTDSVNRAALVLTAVLPLVIGVGLAVMTGMWMFLAFTVVSAVSVLVPVVSGRRQRRDLATAVATALRQDLERRRRAAPPLSDLVVGGPPSGASHERAPGEQRIWLRLGLAAQSANIRFEPAAPELVVPSAGVVPLVLDPANSLTTVSGPAESLDGLMRSLIMQLAGYPRAVRTRVVVHGPAGRLPLSGRFLSSVTLTATKAAATAALAGEHGPTTARGVLLMINAGDPTDDGIKALAAENHWQVIDFRSRPGSMASADIELGERVAELHGPEGTIRFVPDLAPEEVFGNFCRMLSRDAGPVNSSATTVPQTCLLSDLLNPSRSETSARWAASRHEPGLAVPVGQTADGTRYLDLHTDGPHFLVAGTTGSGKSELLRSITAALALSHPPDRINFLFIDFKGGSGLAPLQGLPHCVGMLTDLASHELDRSLVSLRAEVRLREQVLASARAPDLTAYRASRTDRDAQLPHLVVIIDEFRMLVEQAPAALTELMRIAAIGRSLGLHLIMATQRPQGALTADIRANVTTSIALRVQSDMESMDIINAAAASAISLHTPGRAFLARGTEEPEEFQAASLTEPTDRSIPGRLRVRLASESLMDPTGKLPAADDHEDLTPAMAAAPMVEMMSRLWVCMDGQPARPPVAAPLPHVLQRPVVAAAAVSHPASLPWNRNPQGWAISLGMIDLPDEQRTALLDWHPARHGHLGLVGTPEAGVPDALKVTVNGLASHQVESHFYILDADGSLDGIESNCRVGAKAGPQDLRRAVRILERLKQELSLRLGSSPDHHRTPLLLIISGWGTWASSFRSGPLGWAEELVHDLLRDGGRAGIIVAISGQRELVTARFFASVPNRFYFPCGSNDDSRLAWPKMPATAEVPGRVVAFGPLAGGKSAVGQFFAESDDEESLWAVAGKAGGHAVIRRPFRVDSLPATVSITEMMERAMPDTGVVPARPGTRRPKLYPGLPGQQSFVIGLGGDELAPVCVRIPAGGVLAALGGHGGGKTNFLRLLPELNAGTAEWLAPDAGGDACEYWSGALQRAAAGAVGRHAIALVDDADLLPQSAQQDLAALNNRGISVVFTAGFSPLLVQRVPLALSARGSGTGLVIAPRSLMDGDLFGIRFDAEPNPPPGRSVLVANGRPMPVQLGWVPDTSQAPAHKQDAAGLQTAAEPPVRDA